MMKTKIKNLLSLIDWWKDEIIARWYDNWKPRLLQILKIFNKRLGEEYHYFINKYWDEETNIYIAICATEHSFDTPYFIVYNNKNFLKAKKVARISMMSSQYEWSSRCIGRKNWYLNNNEKQLLNTILRKPAIDRQALKYKSNATIWDSILYEYQIQADCLDSVENNNENYPIQDYSKLQKPTRMTFKEWINWWLDEISIRYYEEWKPNFILKIGILKKEFSEHYSYFIAGTGKNDENMYVAICVATWNPEYCDQLKPIMIIYDNYNFLKSKKIARISMTEPKYVCNSKCIGKKNWVLNKEEKNTLLDILHSSNTDTKFYLKQAGRSSVWDYLIYQYQLQGCWHESSEMKNFDFNYPIPDYTKLP